MLRDLPATESRNPAYDLLLACCYRELAQSVGELDGGAAYGEEAFDLLSRLNHP